MQRVERVCVTLKPASRLPPSGRPPSRGFSTCAGSVHEPRRTIADAATGRVAGVIKLPDAESVTVVPPVSTRTKTLSLEAPEASSCDVNDVVHEGSE